MFVLKSNTKTPNLGNKQTFPKLSCTTPGMQGREAGKGPHLALGELPEHGSQAIVIHVAVGFDGHVEDVDGLLPGTLQGQGNVPCG